MRVRRFNESKSFTDIITDMSDKGEVIRSLDIIDHNDLIGELQDKREKVSSSDLNFVLNLFKGSFILNEEIFFKRKIDYSEYDDSDLGWREEDVRKYSKWKAERGESKVEVECDYIPMKSIKDGDSWITFTKYNDDWWLIIYWGDGTLNRGYKFWICDSRDGLVELKKLNL